MLRLHSSATGIFSTSMPRDMEKLPPYKDAMSLIRIAIPVNPPDRSPDGRIKVCITKVCSSADAVTARIVISLRMILFLLYRANIVPVPPAFPVVFMTAFDPPCRTRQDCPCISRGHFHLLCRSVLLPALRILCHSRTLVLRTQCCKRCRFVPSSDHLPMPCRSCAPERFLCIP